MCVPISGPPLKSADGFIMHVAKTLRRASSLSTSPNTEIFSKKWVRYVEYYQRHGELPAEHDADDLGDVALRSMLDPLVEYMPDILSLALLQSDKKVGGEEVTPRTWGQYCSQCP